jgi:hypothetical protein
VRTLAAAAGLLIGSFGPALSDSVTASVKAWDSANRAIMLEDFSQFGGVPAKVAVPAGLKEGDEVVVDFEASENGVEAISSVRLIMDVAKRQLPPTPQKRG